MKRYVQTFLRHKVLLIAPLVISLMVSFLYVKKQPQTYVTTAALWADAPLPADSSSTGGNNSPAGAQSSVLAELLYTRDFVDKVGKRMAASGKDPGKIGKGISVMAIGSQVM